MTGNRSSEQFFESDPSMGEAEQELQGMPLSDSESVTSPGDSNIARSAIVEWLSGQDTELAEQVDLLEKQEPDIFASEAEEIEHIIRLAELAGKRKLLDKIAERLASEQQQSS